MSEPLYEYCCNEDDVFYHIVMTNTKTKTKTNIKCIEDPTYAIFSKSSQFKDINSDESLYLGNGTSDHRNKNTLQ